MTLRLKCIGDETLNANLIKRIEKIETPSRQPRWKAAVFDESTQLYTGQDIGGPLTLEAFKEWCSKQDPDMQIIVATVCENKPKLIIENYADKNTEDLFKEELGKRVDSLIKFSREEGA